MRHLKETHIIIQVCFHHFTTIPSFHPILFHLPAISSKFISSFHHFIQIHFIISSKPIHHFIISSKTVHHSCFLTSSISSILLHHFIHFIQILLFSIRVSASFHPFYSIISSISSAFQHHSIRFSSIIPSTLK